jgi:hypothetical protein
MTNVTCGRTRARRRSRTHRRPRSAAPVGSSRVKSAQPAHPQSNHEFKSRQQASTPEGTVAGSSQAPSRVTSSSKSSHVKAAGSQVSQIKSSHSRGPMGGSHHIQSSQVSGQPRGVNQVKSAGSRGGESSQVSGTAEGGQSSQVSGATEGGNQVKSAGSRGWGPGLVRTRISTTEVRPGAT